MNPSEAFDTLSHHADKRHDFMVRTIGQDALLAALEMRAMNENAVVSLDEEEFGIYLSQREDEDDSEPIATPEDTYDEEYASFTGVAYELFGTIEGYTLVSADEKGLFLDKTIAAPEDALSASIHLFAQVINNEIVLHKNHQIMAGSQSGITQLPVTERDIQIAHEALERLKMVNESL